MDLGNSWKFYFIARDSISSVFQCKVGCCLLGFLAYLQIGSGLKKSQRQLSLLSLSEEHHYWLLNLLINGTSVIFCQSVKFLQQENNLSQGIVYTSF